MQRGNSPSHIDDNTYLFDNVGDDDVRANIGLGIDSPRLTINSPRYIEDNHEVFDNVVDRDIRTNSDLDFNSPYLYKNSP